MKKTNENYALFTAIFCSMLILANVIASKVLIGFNGNIVIPCAVIAYPITFLMTDVIGELWGKERANNTVKCGLVCQIICLIVQFVAVKLPGIDPETSASFATIFTASVGMTVASIVSYVCSQSWDVFIFHKIRDSYIHKKGSRDGGRWIWNNVSTMTSQIIDTIIFIGIGFGVFMGYDVSTVIQMCVCQYIVKFIVAVIDTPFFYILTNERS